MRLLFLTFAFLLALAPASIAADIEKDVVVKVNGMVCDFCAQSLQKVFGKEESVNQIDVSLDDQTVTIDTKDNMNLSDEKIKELIEWGGYDLVEITRPK